MGAVPGIDFDDEFERDVERIRQMASKEQYEKFKKAARETGADESEEAFTERLKKLVKPKRKKDRYSDD